LHGSGFRLRDPTGKVPLMRSSDQPHRQIGISCVDLIVAVEVSRRQRSGGSRLIDRVDHPKRVQRRCQPVA